jgi:transcriptional regulator with XRE-family HTH domain
MDWKKIIADLVASGMTQLDIAKRIGIKQPSVCSIASGKTKDVRHSVGERLRALHFERCDAKKEAA